MWIVSVCSNKIKKKNRQREDMNADKIDSGEGLFFRLCAQPLYIYIYIYPSVMSIDFYFFFRFFLYAASKKEDERIFFFFIYFHIRLFFFCFSVGGSDIKREMLCVVYQERIGKRLWFRPVGRLQSIFFSLFSLSAR